MSCAIASDVTMTLEDKQEELNVETICRLLHFKYLVHLLYSYQTDLVVRYLMKVVIRPPYLIFHNHRAK